VHDLDVGEVMPQAAGAVRGPGGLDRVQGVAHRPVAEGVEVDLEALAVQGGHEAGQFGRVDEVEAGVLGRAPVRVEVGLEHRGGVGLGHPVEHHLDAGGAEPPGLPGLPPPEQVGELVQAAVPFPPQRPDHVGQQPPGLGGPQVGGHVVPLARVAADDGVLPAGDAQGQQVVLGGGEPGVHVLVGSLRQQPGHQVRGALLERAGRLAAGVALDPAVGGIGGRGVDAGQPQRGGVDPGAVPVPVGEERGPAAGHGVQRLAAGQAAGEGFHRPPAPGDPVQVRVGPGVPVDDGQVVRGGHAVPQVAAAQLAARVHRVHVGVDEAGQQRPAAQVDQADPGQALAAAASGAGGDLAGRPHRGDGPAPHPDAGPGRQEGPSVEDRPVLEDDLFASDRPSSRHCHLRKPASAGFEINSLA
jgi:hypothetical protein